MVSREVVEPRSRPKRCTWQEEVLCVILLEQFLGNSIRNTWPDLAWLYLPAFLPSRLYTLSSFFFQIWSYRKTKEERRKKSQKEAEERRRRRWCWVNTGMGSPGFESPELGEELVVLTLRSSLNGGFLFSSLLTVIPLSHSPTTLPSLPPIP